jgi:hypothetical protein
MNLNYTDEEIAYISDWVNSRIAEWSKPKKAVAA